MIFKRCAFGIGWAVLACALANAAPPLTIVQDVLFNADGTKFNGLANISWLSFEASDMSNIPAHTISTQIVNGLLRVQLVPTTNALSPASYSVTYNSNGNIEFNETWAVPPSNVPVRVRDIRIGSPGSTIGSGGGGGGGGNPPPVLTTVNIADVVGLGAALNLRPTLGTGYAPSHTAVIDGTGSINAAVGNASDCMHVDGTSAPCGSGSTTSGSNTVFIDGEIPAGVINGINTAFTLGNAPNPASSLMLFRNGLLLKQGLDYTLNGVAATFIAASTPVTNDLLIASYRYGVAPTGYAFVDSEIPGGIVDGSNSAFSLSQTPSPQSSLALYRNGLRLRANLDYVLTANSIVFQPGATPQTGDVLLGSYRVPGH